MSSILTNFYEKVRASINVSDLIRNIVSLKKKGAEFSGLCPFHSEKTPSFTVNDQKRFYHCFGCGAHGDVIKFESERYGLSYRDAAYKLADKYSVELPKFTKEQEEEQKVTDRILNLLTQANSFFVSNLNKKIIDILLKRGLTLDTIKKYQIGFTGNKGSLIDFFNKKNVRLEELEACGLLGRNQDGKYYEIFRDRITIPILSNFGKVIAFGGRSIGDEMPKYLNSPETLIFKKGESLYGEDIATGAAYKSARAIVVEGYFDVIALHQAGFLESVASLGTAITNSHLHKLWKISDEIIICLDGDSAGIRASKKALDTAIPMISSNHKLSFALLPESLDPDDVVKKYGRDEFAKILNSRMSLSEYIFYNFTYKKTFSTPEEKAELERSLLEIASRIQDKLLYKNIWQYFKNQCWALFNNRNTGDKARANQYKIQVTQPSSYTEIENIEFVIIGYIISCFNSFDIEKSCLVLRDISATNEKLSNFIECVLEILETNHHISDIELTDKIKKTSFLEQLNIVSIMYKNSISGSLDSITNLEILEFLLTKRHLIHLVSELSDVMHSENENLETRLEYYFSEIKNTKDKIDNFNRFLTINNV